MASILLANGANVTQPDAMTLEAPAHLAVRQKQYQMLALLFAYAADPDQRDKAGISPRQVRHCIVVLAPRNRQELATCVCCYAGSGAHRC